MRCSNCEPNSRQPLRKPRIMAQHMSTTTWCPKPQVYHMSATSLPQLGCPKPQVYHKSATTLPLQNTPTTTQNRAGTTQMWQNTCLPQVCHKSVTSLPQVFSTMLNRRPSNKTTLLFPDRMCFRQHEAATVLHRPETRATRAAQKSTCKYVDLVCF